MNKIDKNVIIHDHASTKYPFRHMVVGDSFLYSSNRGMTTLSNACSCYNSYLKGKNLKNKVKFTAKVTEEGVRIWMVKSILSNNKIDIDKDVPVVCRKESKKKNKYPFKKMKVGDSFLFSKKTDRRTHAKACSDYNKYLKWHNLIGEVKFTARKTTRGIKIWRIK